MQLAAATVCPQTLGLRDELRGFLHDTLGPGDDQVRAVVNSIDPRVLLDTGYKLLGSAMNVGSGTVILLPLVMFMCVDVGHFLAIFPVVKRDRAAFVDA